MNSKIELAVEFARNWGCNTVAPAGKVGDVEYYHIFNDYCKGKKTGNPRFIKIYPNNSIVYIEELKELMLAFKRYNKLSNYGANTLNNIRIKK